MPYDIFRDGELDVQLKVGLCEMINYRIGDEVPIPDGAYIAPDGVVMIAHGRFVGITERLYSKWGDEIDLVDATAVYHPVKIALEEIKREMGEKR